MSAEQVDPDTRPGARRGRGRTATAVRFAGSVLTAAVLLAAASVLAVAVLVPRIGGATPYTVLTDSMRPAYPPGTMIVVRHVAADEVALGTVITFRLVSGQPTVATHRVVSIAPAGPTGSCASSRRATPTTPRTSSGSARSRCGARSGTRCRAWATSASC